MIWLSLFPAAWLARSGSDRPRVRVPGPRRAGAAWAKPPAVGWDPVGPADQLEQPGAALLRLPFLFCYRQLLGGRSSSSSSSWGASFGPFSWRISSRVRGRTATSLPVRGEKITAVRRDADVCGHRGGALGRSTEESSRPSSCRVDDVIVSWLAFATRRAGLRIDCDALWMRKRGATDDGPGSPPPGRRPRRCRRSRSCDPVPAVRPGPGAVG